MRIENFSPQPSVLSQNVCYSEAELSRVYADHKVSRMRTELQVSKKS